MTYVHVYMCVYLCQPVSEYLCDMHVSMCICHAGTYLLLFLLSTQPDQSAAG